MGNSTAVSLNVRIYSIFVPVLVTLCLVACSLNALIVAAACRVRRLLNPALAVTVSLAVADLWASLLLASALVMNSYLPTVMDFDFARRICVSYAVEALRLGGIVTTVLHLLMISLFHYWCISRPIFYQNRVKRRALSVALAAIWILPSSEFLVIFSSVEGTGFRAPLCYPTHRALDHFPFRITVFLHIAIPLLCMSILYVLVGINMSRTPQFLAVSRGSMRMESLQRLRNSRGSLTSSTGLLQNATRPPAPRGRLEQLRLQRKKRTMNTALLIVASFLLSWFPSAVFYIVSCEACPLPWSELHVGVAYTVTIVNYLLMVLKGIFNPILYALRIPELHVVFFRPAATSAVSEATQL